MDGDDADDDDLCRLDVFDACPEKRDVCAACDRPRRVCWCAFVASPKIRLASRVVIVQHPKERTRRIRTAHMAVAAIAEDRCVIERESRFPGKSALLSSLVDSPSSRLLFPSAEAVPLDQLNPADGPFTFVVLDGTWDEAAKMLARSPALRRMPAVSLARSDPASSASSAYVVRTQPNDACRSTVETVAEIVAVTEDDPALRDLILRPLHAMCNAQINHGAVAHDSKNLAEVNSRFEKLRSKKRARRVIE